MTVQLSHLLKHGCFKEHLKLLEKDNLDNFNSSHFNYSRSFNTGVFSFKHIEHLIHQYSNNVLNCYHHNTCHWIILLDPFFWISLFVKKNSIIASVFDKNNRQKKDALRILNSGNAHQYFPLVQASTLPGAAFSLVSFGILMHWPRMIQNDPKKHFLYWRKQTSPYSCHSAKWKNGERTCDQQAWSKAEANSICETLYIQRWHMIIVIWTQKSRYFKACYTMLKTKAMGTIVTMVVKH